MINSGFTQFYRDYKVQFKPRTPYAPKGLVVNSNGPLNTFIPTVLDTHFDTWTLKVNIFPNAVSSQVRTNMAFPHMKLFLELNQKDQ